MPPPTPPGNMFIKAEPTDAYYRIRVTWADFQDEDGYQLVGNTSSTPGPVFPSGGGPDLGSSWELITNLNADATEFVHETMWAHTYAICGLKGHEIACVGPSNYARPKHPLLPASISSLQVSRIATDRLRVQWIQSSNTIYSRAEVKDGSNIVSTVENDPDQTVTFTGLQPNKNYTIKVCVRNEAQTAASEACGSTQARTLPLVPLAPTSLGVNQTDPDPRQRSIDFSYDNQQAHAVIAISVRLIKDDQVVADHYVYPNTFGMQEYQHTFSDLQPFTAYEAWIAPYNQSGVGPAAGIGFTTPAEVKLAVQPLSSDSVMLRWHASAIGQYTIQRKNGTAWDELYTVRLLRTGEQRIVLEGIDGPTEVRVAWKLAYLNTQSTPVVAAPLRHGVPELLSVQSQPVFLSNRFRFGTSYTFRFRTTVGGNAEYILQRKAEKNWVTAVSTGPELTRAGTVITLKFETTKLRVPYRVCRRQSKKSFCGPSDEWTSQGLIRVRLPSV